MSGVDELIDFLHEKVDDMLDADADNHRHVYAKRSQQYKREFDTMSAIMYLNTHSGYFSNNNKIDRFRERIYSGEKPVTYNEATAKIELLENLIAHGKRFEDCDWQIERTVRDINEYVDKYDLSDLFEKAKKTADKWDEIKNFDPKNINQDNNDDLDFALARANAIVDQGSYWSYNNYEENFRDLLKEKKIELNQYNTDFLKYYFSIQNMARAVWWSKVTHLRL